MNSARNTEGGLNGARGDRGRTRRPCAMARSRFAPAQFRPVMPNGLTLLPRESLSTFY